MEHKIAKLRHCHIHTDGWKVTVVFGDGHKCDAVPHMTNHYHVISHRCGYEDDVARYCFEHEVAHAVVAEFLWKDASPVLLAVASGATLSGPEAAGEELLAQSLQRFVRAGERPIIGGVDWGGMRKFFLEVLGE